MLYYLTILIVLTVSVRCDVYRLPNNIRPTRYTLTMEPDLLQDLYKPVPYNGSVIIELEILENTKNITLHKALFNIDKSSIAIVNSKGAEIKPSATIEDEETQTYTICVDDELVEEENYNLTIGNFYGELREGEGFFLAMYHLDYDYMNPRGAAVTHFEPTVARTAFPCFDEPAMKANFKINLIRREGYHSLSNEELESTEDLGNGRYRDTFKETPKMSTYIVAFTVSDFIPTAKLDRQRIFTSPMMKDNEKKNYSLRVAVEALKALEEYTGIDFPLNKIDHFAVSDGQFKESAMENMGLIIYVESYLFSTRHNYYRSPYVDEKRATICIAHEVAHQWFGNMVTPAWWDYIWLSESFAAYFQYYIASFIQPTWNLKDQYVVDVVQKALRTEEEVGAHPLNYHIKKDELYPPFYIMYEKGGSIIRMMEHFLTHDVFRRGLQIYLQNRKFSTAVPADLYSALQKAVDEKKTHSLLNNLTVTEIMQSWDSNEGFPLVTVTRSYASGIILIEQEPRSKNWTIKENWKIPINYIFASNSKTEALLQETTADFWLTDKAATLNDNFPTDGWLLVNKQQTGYYRVNYDEENWERIIKFLNSEDFETIHVLNRAQLIDDSFSLAHDKKIPSEIPLRLCEYLVREKDYVPWVAFYEAISTYVPLYHGKENKNQEAFFKGFSHRKNLNSTLDNYNVFQEYVKSVTSELRNHLTAHNESQDSYFDNLNRWNLNNYFPYYFGDQL